VDFFKTRQLGWVDPEEGTSDAGVGCGHFRTDVSYLPDLTA
jgi:hypothetical protein